MKFFNQQLLSFIILSIIFGFLAGIIGFVFMGYNNMSLPFFGGINFDNLNPDQKIIIEQPRNVVVQQDRQLQQVENDLLPSLVNIYRPTVGNKVSDQIYLPNEFLGQGFVLTADGWVVSVAGTIANFQSRYDVVGYQSKEYQLSDFVLDEATGVVFAKMPASNLPVARLGSHRDLILGQTVVVISQRRKVELAQIKDIGLKFDNINQAMQSSDDLNKEIILNISLSNVYNGAIVATLDGKIVGLVDRGRVIIVDYFSDYIAQVLKDQKIVRPVLGINYIDLAQVEGLVEKGERGALVYGNPIVASPAYNLLKDGDLIKKIDDIEINVFRSLSELIQGYKPGDNIELLIQRGSEELAVDVVLK